MRLFGILMVVVLVSGCATEMVRKVYSPAKGGTIRYGTGWFMAGHNRSTAVEKMNEFCRPARAKLLSEDSKSEFTGSSRSSSKVGKDNIDTTTTQDTAGYVYLHFECVKRAN